MLKIVLLISILTASLSWAMPSVETGFIQATPKIMQVFNIFGDATKTQYIKDQLKTPIAANADPKAIATRKLMEILVNPTTNPNQPQTIKAILELYADVSLPETSKNLKLGKLEALSIYSYSTDDYKTINPELRKVQPSGEALAYSAMVNASLDKLPPFVGLAKRGANLPDSELDKMVVGNIVEFAAFTSATADLSLKNFEKRHRMMIRSKKGRDISNLSANPQEREVLFKAGSKFKVISVKQNAPLGGFTADIQIELEEL